MQDYINNNIKEEVYKCSKCGLCQSVCPIYIAKKNEMYLPRGRYNVLNNFYNNNKPLTEKFIKDLDICLNCNACKRFCPSNIDSYKIFTLLKSKNSYKYSFLPFHILYKLILNILRIAKYIYKFFLFKSIFLNSIVDYLYDVKIKKRKKSSLQNKEKIVYFEGCINKYINPSDKNAAINVLNNLDYKIIKINSNCCGLPFLSDGNIKGFENNKKKILKAVPAETKYIVCSCDSCYETLSEIHELKEKLIRFDEILKINNIKIRNSNNIIYHKPLNREDVCYLPVNAIEINKKGVCSLMENYFLIKHHKLAADILKNSFYNKEDIEDKILLSSCNLTLIGLKYCISKIKSNTKVYSLAEYVNLLTKND